MVVAAATRVIALVAAAICVASCDNMANQPKRLAYEAYNNNPQSVGRWREPEGTVAREERPGDVDEIIADGTKKARTIAQATLAQVKAAMGLT